MTTATKTKTPAKTKTATPDEIQLVPSPELIEALEAERVADAIVAEGDRANQTVYEQVEAEAAKPAKTKTVAERVAKVKAEKTPKAKTMHPKTAARLQWILDTPGQHTVSDVRKGTPEVSPYDRATRDSLRQLVAAGLIATGKSEGGVEVFFALASTEAPAAK